MSGNRMLVWLVFSVFICLVVAFVLAAPPQRSGKGSVSETTAFKAAAVNTGVRTHTLAK